MNLIRQPEQEFIIIKKEANCLIGGLGNLQVVK